MTPRLHRTLLAAALLLVGTTMTGCVSVPSAPARAATAAPAPRPQQVRAVPAWPTPVEPSTHSTLEATGPRAPAKAPSTRTPPAPAAGANRPAAERNGDRPRTPPRRKTSPRRTSHERPSGPRRGSASTRRPAPKAARPPSKAVRPAAPQTSQPRRRPRTTYNPGIICSWGAGAGLDPATVAACRKQHGG
ncbi:hypothetical protein [Streptomyces candidus]|uniref:Lipoprotein n=1 Tax=Streptomyces candidus TaxID=67283 RepID=A0A7X0LSD3_9ACTN|nr:hypothetical protein [Streptomyces candidus]MBB6439573.1 hypothetical protein [Streptomyces candidus]GHH54624.1 hypothetical protein GCM10018773_57870 [Streptomyces candidus]